jgi:D-methionine transport system permease protein
VQDEWSTFNRDDISAAGQTVWIVLATLLVSAVAGSALGLLLYATRPGGILANRLVSTVLDVVINIVRPVPFIILIFAIAALRRLVVGSSLGRPAAVFTLSVAATFAVARVVENNLVAVDPGVVEAARAMGASPARIVFGIVVPEALGPLVLGFTFMLVALIDFSAMAGTMGGGGLGQLALVYGYQRFDYRVILVTIALLIIFVQAAQLLGNALSRRLLRR